jgi:lipopolysaccharide export LptBFGC system permease protein LptF
MCKGHAQQTAVGDSTLIILKLITEDATKEFINLRGKQIAEDSLELTYDCNLSVPHTTRNTVSIFKDTSRTYQPIFFATVDSNKTERQAEMLTRDWKKELNQVWEGEYNTKNDYRKFGGADYFYYSIIKDGYQWWIQANKQKEALLWKVLIILYRIKEE